MKRKASWLVESFEKTETKFDEIVAIATSYDNELSESDKTELNEILNDARDNGWYPFVSVYYFNESVDLFDERIEAIANVKKDPYIWEVLMLGKELPIIKKEFSEDFDEKAFRTRLNAFKAKL